MPETGTQTQGNLQDGITFLNFASDNTIVGNVIAGNTGNGVNLSSGSTGNLIEGNMIGTNAKGTQGLGNAQNGVYINDVSGNTIGGTSPGVGNLISGNGLNGVLIAAGTNETQTTSNGMVRGNTVEGNKIGVDFTGTTAIGNGQNGVFLNGSPVNTIGGSTPGAGNVISGNRLSGISLFDMASSGNVVQGNTIGTDAGGHSAVRNFQDGVLLTGAIDNLLGGTDGSARNLISGNAGDGIAIVNAGASGDGSGNMIEGNTIGTDASGNGIAITQTTSIQIGGTSAGARHRRLRQRHRDHPDDVHPDRGDLGRGPQPHLGQRR